MLDAALDGVAWLRWLRWLRANLRGPIKGRALSTRSHQGPRSCNNEERTNLRQIWTSITVRQQSRVERATPIESATHVLSAAPVAIDQPLDTISSVVDVVSAPSIS
ncbi:hypothetical protein R1sor_010230 [Riccia sorocarpa]|uniref:Uncharacterized protein n=1 Tax=Riccia sorocarpa TaxID=122646 RepID=A0ABD3I3H6_9MARC